MQKVSSCGGGGSWEWKCNLCHLLYKGSYPRVKAHLLHDARKGIEHCTKTNDPVERRKCREEQKQADRTKNRHTQLSNASPPAPNSVPRIVQEVRKRRVSQQNQDASKLANMSRGASLSASPSDSRIATLHNAQGREEAETRVARAIYACGIPFNVVRSPYWQDMVRAINTAPQGFKGPNYEKSKPIYSKRRRSLWRIF